MEYNDSILREGDRKQVGRAQMGDVPTNSADNRDYMMPGLVPQIVNTFLAPKKHLTVRGVSRRKAIAETFVITALFRELFSQVSALREIASRKPVQSETTVRHYQEQRLVTRRAA